jgi:MFS family permease
MSTDAIHVVSSDLALKRRRRVFVGLILAMILAALDQSIVSTALPVIAGELGRLDHLTWVVTAFMLTSTVSAPLYGKLSDMYGRKPFFAISIGLFLVASALCGAAHSMTALIGFRALQGLGAGGLMTMSQTLVGSIVPMRERGRYQGLFTGAFAVSSVASPLLGGFITGHASWRWVFYVNLPIGTVSLALIRFRGRSPVDAMLLVTFPMPSIVIDVEVEAGRRQRCVSEVVTHKSQIDLLIRHM